MKWKENDMTEQRGLDGWDEEDRESVAECGLK